jgi:SAM-dependent methyltransferase
MKPKKPVPRPLRHGRGRASAPVFGRKLADYSLIDNALHEYGGELQGKRVLHIGSSYGVYERYLQRLGMKPIGFDLSHYASRAARRIGAKAVVADAKTTFPFADNSLDFFVSGKFLFSNYRPLEGGGESMQYNYGSTEVLKEALRVLKPHGIGIINLHSKAGDIFNNQRFQKMHGIQVLKKTPELVVFRKKAE